MNNFYALYHGDSIVTVADNIYELAQFMDISISSVRWLASPAAHKRYENKNANLIYKYEV